MMYFIITIYCHILNSFTRAMAQRLCMTKKKEEDEE